MWSKFYPVFVCPQGGHHVLHGPFHQNTSDESEALAIWLVLQSLFERSKDKSVRKGIELLLHVMSNGPGP
jgi:hypothetical protein